MNISKILLCLVCLGTASVLAQTNMPVPLEQFAEYRETTGITPTFSDLDRITQLLFSERLDSDIKRLEYQLQDSDNDLQTKVIWDFNEEGKLLSSRHEQYNRNGSISRSVDYKIEENKNGTRLIHKVCEPESCYDEFETLKYVTVEDSIYEIALSYDYSLSPSMVSTKRFNQDGFVQQWVFQSLTDSNFEMDETYHMVYDEEGNSILLDPFISYCNYTRELEDKSNFRLEQDCEADYLQAMSAQVSDIARDLRGTPTIWKTNENFFEPRGAFLNSANSYSEPHTVLLKSSYFSEPDLPAQSNEATSLDATAAPTEDTTTTPIAPLLGFKDRFSPTLSHRLWRHDARISALAFNGDDTRLVTASEDATLNIWDVEAGEPLQTLTGHQEWVNAVAYSPDGTLIASGSDDKSVRVWDATTGQELYSLLGHSKWVGSVVFSPDGQSLLTAAGDKQAILWDLDTKTERFTLEGHKDWLRATYSPDGALIATGSGDNSIKLWDAQTGELQGTLSGHTDSVLLVRFSPDSNQLASASSDGTIKLWNIQSGEERSSLSYHDDWVVAIDFHPTAPLLASVSRDDTWLIWDLSISSPIATGQSDDDILAVAFSHDGLQMALGLKNNSAELWTLLKE